MGGAFVVVDTARELDGLACFDSGINFGHLRPGNCGFDNARVPFPANDELAIGDGAAIDGSFGLAREEMLARHSGRLQPVDFRTATELAGNGIESEFVVGVPIGDEARHYAGGILEPRFIFQDVESDLNVVMLAATGRYVKVLAIGKVPHPSGPIEFYVVPADGMVGIKIRVIIASGEPDHARIRGGIDSLGSKIKVAIVEGQIRGGEAVGHVLIKLPEGEPCGFGHVFADFRTGKNLGKNPGPIGEIAVNRDGAASDEVHVKIFRVRGVAIGGGVKFGGQGIQVALSGFAARNTESDGGGCGREQFDIAGCRFELEITEFDVKMTCHGLVENICQRDAKKRVLVDGSGEIMGDNLDRCIAVNRGGTECLEEFTEGTGNSGGTQEVAKTVERNVDSRLR